MPEKKAEAAPQEEAAEEVKLVRVRCRCRNVHLGNGEVLRTQRIKNAKGFEVDIPDEADIPEDIALMLAENGQVELV